MKNLLESYGAQEGLAGPASNILGSMGVNIPPNMDNIENGETTGNLPDKLNKDTKKTKVSFEDPRIIKEEISKADIEEIMKENKSVKTEQKTSVNTGNRPQPKPRPKAAAKGSAGGTQKAPPPRPPPPRAGRTRPRLDSKETDV